MVGAGQMRTHRRNLHDKLTPRNLAAYVIAILLSLQFTHCSHADEITAKQFLDEAPEAWNKYRASADSLSGRVRSRRLLGDRLMADSIIVYKASGQNRLAVVEALPPVTDLRNVISEIREGNVYGKNQSYSFRLQRQTPDLPWILVDYHIPNKGSKSALEVAFNDFSLRKREAICLLGFIDLSELIKHPNFRIVKITRVPSGNEVLQEVAFSNTHKVEQKPFNPIQSGTLLFDPKHQWCLRSYKVVVLSSDSESVMTAHFDYKFHGENAILKKCKKTQVVEKWFSPATPADIPNVITSETEYDLEPNKTWPDEDFTLSAFGLPEPSPVSWWSQTPWWLWISLGGIAMLVLGAGFSWLRKRYAARAAA
jgi:hypothetical protein